MSYMMQIPGDTKQWYAVHCKFRCEKRLMNEFLADGIEAYAPMLEKIRQYSSRKKRSEVALIPSHIFVQVDRSDYLSIVRHPHIFGFLNCKGTVTCIRQVEMDLMRRVVGEYNHITFDNTSLYDMGDEVEIINGELTGLRGKLVDADNHRFKVELKSLGWGLIINVDPKHLLRIGSSRKVA